MNLPKPAAMRKAIAAAVTTFSATTLLVVGSFLEVSDGGTSFTGSEISACLVSLFAAIAGTGAVYQVENERTNR